MKKLIEIILGFIFKCIMTFIATPALCVYILFSIVYWEEKYFDYGYILLHSIWENEKK